MFSKTLQVCVCVCVCLSVCVLPVGHPCNIICSPQTITVPVSLVSALKSCYGWALSQMTGRTLVFCGSQDRSFSWHSCARKGLL